MKVFLSWSGDLSRAVAELLKQWLPDVLHTLKPWVSTHDINRGEQWNAAVQGQLQDTQLGIVCLTHENKEKPWILFEAGALMKGLSEARVCTLLIDLKPADVEFPLAQFQHTLPTREEIFKLVKTINDQAGEHMIPDDSLLRVFNRSWPDFEKPFKEALSAGPKKVKPKRGLEEMLAEVLEHTRTLVGSSRKEANRPILSLTEQVAYHTDKIAHLHRTLHLLRTEYLALEEFGQPEEEMKKVREKIVELESELVQSTNRRANLNATLEPVKQYIPGGFSNG